MVVSLVDWIAIGEKKGAAGEGGPVVSGLFFFCYVYGDAGDYLGEELH